MKIKEILLEYNKEYLIKIFSDKFTEKAKKDPSISVDSLENFLREIEDFSRKNGFYQFTEPYMKWIVHRYVNDKIESEEELFTKVLQYLVRYDLLKKKNKLKPEHKDINKIEDTEQLKQILDLYEKENILSKKKTEKEIEKSFYERGEAKLIYDDSLIKIVVPLSLRASCFFGRNTKWCTASRDSEEAEESFYQYKKAGDLYIILIKPKNERYQFHFETEQFVDERDLPVNPNDLAEKYPKLWEIFEPIAKKNKTLFLIKEPTEEEQIEFVKRKPNNIKFIKNPSEKVQIEAVRKFGDSVAYIKNPSEKVQIEAVKNSPSSISYISKPSEKVQLEAVKRNGMVISFISNPSEKVQLEAVKNEVRSIKFMDYIPEKTKIEAIKINPKALKYLDVKGGVTENILEFFIKTYPDLVEEMKHESFSLYKYLEKKKEKENKNKD